MQGIRRLFHLLLKFGKKYMNDKNTIKIRVGDTVRMLIGKNRGKTGKVMAVMPEKRKVIVEGLNMVKKHVRPKKQGEKGQRVTVAASTGVSNVKFVCPQCKKDTRIGIRRDADGRHRVCKKCNSDI